MFKMIPSNVSLITTSKGRLHHLKITINNFLLQETHEVIVVDYGCPDGTYDWCMAQNNNRLKVVRAANIIDLFNIDRARNIGAKLASSDLLLFADADNLMPLSFTTNCLNFMFNEEVDLCCPVYDIHMFGTCMVKTAIWKVVRGFDEEMVGWGYDDIDFYDRIKYAGYSRGLFSGHGLTAMIHPDSESTQFYANQNKEETALINYKRMQDHTRKINQCGYGLPILQLI